MADLGICKIIRELWRAYFQVIDKYLSKNVWLGTRWVRPKDKFLDLSVIKCVLELYCAKVNMFDLIDIIFKFSRNDRSKIV